MEPGDGKQRMRRLAGMRHHATGTTPLGLRCGVRAVHQSRSGKPGFAGLAPTFPIYNPPSVVLSSLKQQHIDDQSAERQALGAACGLRGATKAATFWDRPHYGGGTTRNAFDLPTAETADAEGCANVRVLPEGLMEPADSIGAA